MALAFVGLSHNDRGQLFLPNPALCDSLGLYLVWRTADLGLGCGISAGGLGNHPDQPSTLEKRPQNL